jgi:hypothetical protein
LVGCADVFRVLVVLWQDLRTLRFAHRQENHSRRQIYDAIMSLAFVGAAS